MIIRKMLERMDNGKRWHKGSLGDHSRDTTPVCTLGAYYSVVEDLQGMSYKNGYGDDIPELAAIAQVIREQYDFQDGKAHASTIITWFNDNEPTTWEDVEKVLEKAALLFEENNEPA